MIQRHGSMARWSEACVHNGVAYLSGQLADDTSEGFVSQFSQTLAAIDRALAMVGSDKSQLLTATIYMKDLTYMPELNAAWEAWLPIGSAPGRTTIQAEMVDPNCLVEITVIAAVGAPVSGVLRVAEGY
jgi:enamine deaminase RidA (YjgF/YER057c/UK114 family)